jgi:tetratricopeptide (TPR) repeat protein
LLADTLTNLSEMKMFAGRLDAAEKDAREAIGVAETTGNLWGQSYSRGVLSQVLLAFGRYAEAMTEAATSVALGKRAGFALSQIWTPCVIAECLCELGEPARGLAVAREAAEAAEALLVSWRGFPLAVALICYSAMGDCAAAQIAFEEARRAASAMDLSNLMFGVASIEYARACGEPETLLRSAEDGIGRLEGLGFAVYLPVLLTRRSEAEGMLGWPARAEETARRAIASAARMQARRGLWRPWAALADALDAQGRTLEARQAIAHAREEIAYSAENAGGDELRDSFLGTPAIRTLLEDR